MQKQIAADINYATATANLKFRESSSSSTTVWGTLQLSKKAGYVVAVATGTTNVQLYTANYSYLEFSIPTAFLPTNDNVMIGIPLSGFYTSTSGDSVYTHTGAALVYFTINSSGETTYLGYKTLYQGNAYLTNPDYTTVNSYVSTPYISGWETNV